MAAGRRGFLILFLLTAVSLLAVGIPAWLIQPFRHQTPSDLEVSFLLRRWSPIGTLILAVFAVFWVVRLWKGSAGVLRRGLLALACTLSIFAAWFARQNHFEAFFRPLPDPAFTRAVEASFVADTDRVLGVEVNGEAAAYPIRQMAYHHLLHDVVGGVGVVATY